MHLLLLDKNVQGAVKQKVKLLNTYFSSIIFLYVTGFEKTRLPHTFDFMTLVNHNLQCQEAISFILFLYDTTPLCKSFRSLAHSQIELHCLKFGKLDVRGRLVFSNPVTYSVVTVSHSF